MPSSFATRAAEKIAGRPLPAEAIAEIIDREFAEPVMLLPSEVMRRLKISRGTFYRMVSDGRLRAVKVGRGWRVAQESI